MIADFSVRAKRTIRTPTFSDVAPCDAGGLRAKERGWNGKSALLEWRAAWAARANEHLPEPACVRIDHRTLEAQQIELAPGRRIGLGRARQTHALPAISRIGSPSSGHRAAKRRDHSEDPTVALRALTHQRRSFRSVSWWSSCARAPAARTSSARR